jgi:N utilization substance protein B
MSRRAARRTAFFLLYQWDVTGRPLTSLYEGEIDDWARRTAEAVAAESPALDGRITEASESWTADRLGAVERNILRLAVHELEGDEVPDEVAIDEAVTLAKRYASDDAAKLVTRQDRAGEGGVSVARLRRATVGETMFPPGAPFFRGRLSPRGPQVAACAEEQERGNLPVSPDGGILRMSPVAPSPAPRPELGR